MSLWQQWLRRPQNVWLRRAVFQVHLWTGIGVGLYVFAISVTGSAIVFRNELYTWASKRPTVTPATSKLGPKELRAAALRAYPGYAIANVWESKDPAQPTEVWMDNKGHSRVQRFFDPYTGRDMGRSVAYTIKIVSWCGELHADLFGGSTGRKINGIGAALLTLLCLTGMVIWWPGGANWRRALIVNPKSNWKRLNFDLHSAFGFWSLSIILVWALTGVYLGFPEPFQRAINRYYPLEFYRLDFPPAAALEASPVVRIVPVLQQQAPAPGKQKGRRRPQPRLSTGDKIIRWQYYLHF